MEEYGTDYACPHVKVECSNLCGGSVLVSSFHKYVYMYYIDKSVNRRVFFRFPCFCFVVLLLFCCVLGGHTHHCLEFRLYLALHLFIL